MQSTENGPHVPNQAVDADFRSDHKNHFNITHSIRVVCDNVYSYQWKQEDMCSYLRRFAMLFMLFSTFRAI